MSDNYNKIVSLRGDNPNIHNGEPVQATIDRLENLLEQAKSGKLRAIGFALVTIDRSIVTGWDGKADDHDMVCGVTKLFYRYVSASAERDD